MEMHPSPRSSYIEHHRAHNQHRSERTSLTNDSYRHGIQLAANKVQNDTKTTQFGVRHSTKLTSFINWLTQWFLSGGGGGTNGPGGSSASVIAGHGGGGGDFGSSGGEGTDGPNNGPGEGSGGGDMGTGAFGGGGSGNGGTGGFGGGGGGGSSNAGISGTFGGSGGAPTGGGYGGAGLGGAIFISTGTLSLTNATFSHNSASAKEGELCAQAEWKIRQKEET
jgi:hypothetical protein